MVRHMVRNAAVDPPLIPINGYDTNSTPLWSAHLICVVTGPVEQVVLGSVIVVEPRITPTDGCGGAGREHEIFAEK